MHTHVHLNIYKPSYTSLSLTSAGQMITTSVICCCCFPKSMEEKQHIFIWQCSHPNINWCCWILYTFANVCTRVCRNSCLAEATGGGPLSSSITLCLNFLRQGPLNSSLLFQLGFLANSLARLLQVACLSLPSNAVVLLTLVVPCFFMWMLGV